jgi:hypothetical protein
MMVEPPTRILIIVKKGPLVWRRAWEEPQKIITQILTHLEYNKLVSPDDVYDTSDCRFIAVERWDSHTFIVCDLFNINYNPEDAHLDGKNELPVRMVRIYESDHRNSIKAKKPQMIDELGEKVRNIHDMHGWNTSPPYKIDHANGAYPIYQNPRSLKYRT